jgi:hypothetical protein
MSSARCCFGDIVHAVTQPTVAQAVLPHIEALTTTSEQICLGNHQIPNFDLAVSSAEPLP